MFRYQGRERQLEKCCGTVPYVAPELFTRKPYRAEPADIWSCGIILVALLAGGKSSHHAKRDITCNANCKDPDQAAYCADTQADQTLLSGVNLSAIQILHTKWMPYLHLKVIYMYRCIFCTLLYWYGYSFFYYFVYVLLS